jgi:3-deoxy-D-manno-octulosonic-acid transferase
MTITKPFIHPFYNVITSLFLLVATPYLFARSLFDENRRKELLQRLGCFPDLSERRPVWIHAASVGEVLASRSLIKKIKSAFPRDLLLLTTMTRTGQETAREQIPEADVIVFFPMDHPLILRHVMKRVEPRLLLIAETELWPNLLHASGKRGIPIVLFNGRISDRSIRRYLRLKFFFRHYLASISLFLMQTEQDQARIIAIGAPSEKTRVMGNIKYDQAPPDFAGDVAAEMAKTLGLRGEESVFIAGSTRPGEEEILLPLFKELREEIPHLLLLLAPRHLDRLEEVEKILRRETLHWVRRTSLPVLENVSNRHSQNMPNIILLDTMGELVKLYSLAKLVFVGGSLVPLGGQNPLEPLFFKKCVLFGPHMSNFAEIARFLTEAQGAVQVKDPEDLRAQIKRLLQDDQARREIGQRGYEVLQKHRGATERIFQEIQPYLLLEEWDTGRME